MMERHEVGDADNTWDPQLSEALFKLLYRTKLGGRELSARLEELALGYQDAVYSELIYLLTQLRYEGDVAHRHWNHIAKHRDELSEKLGRVVDLQVALVSYFVEVNHQIENPKIVELRLFEEARASVYRDELTGLYNHRLFNELLARELDRSGRHGDPVSVVLLDIDGLKQYNDQNGHQAGDEALAEVARRVGDCVRSADVATRYGGEEFALILAHTGKSDAFVVAERARQAIDEKPFPHARLTASLGVATFPGDAKEREELVRCADRAMYVAKELGKNQVQLYGQDRRSHRRVSANLDGRLRTLVESADSCQTLNISERGVLLVCERSLDVGSFLELSVELPEHSQISVGGRVVSARALDQGGFEIGVRLIEVSREAQIQLTRYLREQSACLELR